MCTGRCSGSEWVTGCLAAIGSLADRQPGGEANRDD